MKKKKKIIITIVTAHVIGCLLGPPDTISQLILGVMTAAVCAVLLLVLARFAFVKSASPPMQTLVCVLVCMLSVLLVFCHMLVRRTMSHQREFYDDPPSASSAP
ncbi:MAG: hypothetical protein RBR19_04610 [Sedimentisphaerales bacterium]|jgi:cell shape-determining protein MreD|nr:hypothetical protein [Sedimentisphaerales bacterium]